MRRRAHLGNLDVEWEGRRIDRGTVLDDTFSAFAASLHRAIDSELERLGWCGGRDGLREDLRVFLASDFRTRVKQS